MTHTKRGYNQELTRKITIRIPEGLFDTIKAKGSISNYIRYLIKADIEKDAKTPKE